MSKHVIHWRSIRLFVNAGIRFPACYARRELLDLDKTYLETTGSRDEVTCKHCLRLVRAYEREYGLNRENHNA